MAVKNILEVVKMSFLNDASRANIPINYCRIFSEYVLKVANKIGL